MLPISVTVSAYGVEEKVVAKNTKAAGRILLPVSWVGKKVIVLLQEPFIDENSDPIEIKITPLE